MKPAAGIQGGEKSGNNFDVGTSINSVFRGHTRLSPLSSCYSSCSGPVSTLLYLEKEKFHRQCYDMKRQHKSTMRLTNSNLF